jgi:alpha-glucosidase (family GH31 glycosyl hydrolase)
MANPAATVVSGDARFTILTPGLIRMEWAAGGSFEDHASLTFVNRNLPVPSFRQSETEGWLEITTERLVLRYRKDSGKFTADNLSVAFRVDTSFSTWKPGMKEEGNLQGTTRTLDGYDGMYRQYGSPMVIDLGQGILSRDGWVVIDDSERPLFDDSDWPWVMARDDRERQDWYFFGYGHDYKTALGDFIKTAGRIALPPRFVFGTWWSRYWEYTDKEFRDLVAEFETHSVPLDVLVIDMDWHITSLPEFYRDGKLLEDQSGEGFGWTGLTWNKNYFPDPAKFLDWTNRLGLKTCMNLHPASGVQPHEARYKEMAEAMGVDPATKKYIPFDITDKTFARNYMDIILRPMEKEGIDFWWLDWQQWGHTKIEGVNPTFYLNYVFFSDMERQGGKRPLIFHRYGGPGNHRYQIGFSGDTYITWSSLAFQPYFTATAANVGFGYWSHDIGGHQRGTQDPELYTRWIQWGSFSPILRTHCTKNPEIERRIWAYPVKYYYPMRNACLLRYSLIPYIYNAARTAYETGISVVHPMYYDYPDEENAYAFRAQYLFGDDMLVSPVVKPIGKDSLFTLQRIWLPEGDWYEWFTGTILRGGRVVERPFTLDEMPVYVRSGSIIPMQPDMSRSDEKPVDPLILSIIPGRAGTLALYEDQGNDNGYRQGAYSLTEIAFRNDGDQKILMRINPVTGDFPGMLKTRSYEIRLLCTFPPERVVVNGEELPYMSEPQAGSWRYDGNELSTVILTPGYYTGDTKTIEVYFRNDDPSALSGKKAQFARLMTFVKILANNNWDKSKYSNDRVTDMAQAGLKLTYDPEAAEKILSSFGSGWDGLLEMIRKASEENKALLPGYQLLEATR